MGSKAAAKTSELVQQTKVLDAKRESDTIRLWEGYRDQALLWRALALLQIPATLISALLAMIFFYNQKIILNVPSKPLPGKYSADEIMDVEFKDAATSFINLIATYQPAVARRQFLKAREMITEPLLSNFDNEMIGGELKMIENTKRTQLYFVDPSKMELIRDGNRVHVSMVGDRLKIVAGKELPTLITKYTLTMSTVPRNEINPYGIVIENVLNENVEN